MTQEQPDCNTPATGPVRSGENTGSGARRWPWIVFSVVALLAAASLILMVEDTVDVSETDQTPAPPPIGVLTVAGADTIADISAYVAVQPRWQTEIRAAVSGRIVTVHETALAGTRVAAGAPLISIGKTRYQAGVGDAALRLEEAKLALVRAKNKVVLTRRQHQRTGRKAPSDLALHIPDRRIAELAVGAAAAQLATARQKLADTDITAPFSGFVTERMVSPGQTVGEGDPLLRLADDRQFEMTVELNRRDWNLLDHPVAGKSARLLATTGEEIAPAVIRQGGGFLNEKTRQYRLFLSVAAPEQTGRLLAGDFLRVSLPGRYLTDTLTIPETALARTGHVWSVDDRDRLVRFQPDILFRRGDRIIIAQPDRPDRPDGVETGGIWRIVVTPLASFLPGQKISPKPVGN